MEAERDKIIDEVIEAVKDEIWGWFETECEYRLRCKDLQEVTNKLKNKSNPIRAIQTPFWNWICPTCREGIGLEYECSKCGQKILWGNKENQ